MTKRIHGEIKTRGVTTRKRTRSDDVEDMTPALHMRSSRSMTALSPSIFPEPLSDVVLTPPLRRRVNPASLANRLGPELVAELESLIKPGCTEMPSFAARQAIQKKYDVDRRHIYDWYHTKGLRVSSKSERRAQMMQAEQEEARALRSHYQTKPCLEQPQLEAASNYSTSTSSTPISTPITPHTPMGLQPPFNLNTEYGVVPHLAPFPIHHFLDPPIHGSFAFAPNMQMHGGRPIMPETVDYHTRGFYEYNPFPTGNRTSQWVTDGQNCHVRTNSNESFPFLQHEHHMNENMNPFLPAVTHSQALPKPQREACYRYLSDAVGPAQGVQESVGTYRAFMTQQVQTYYDRLVPGQPAPGPPVVPRLPVSLPPPPIAIPSHSVPQVSHVPQDTHQSASFQAQRRGSSESAQSSHGTPNTPNLEWSHWLLHNQVQAANSTPSSTSTMYTPPLSVSMSSTSNHSLAWPWNPSQNFGTEEESSLEISDILESPVLRTRHNTRNDIHSPSPSASDLNGFTQPPKLGGKFPPFPLVQTASGSPGADGNQDTLKYPTEEPICHPASFSMSLLSAHSLQTEDPTAPRND